MKKEDFERIKAKLGDEFDVTIESMNEAIISVKKKDIWGGVEFFISSWSGKIFRRDQIDDIDIKNHNGHLSPSTEAAYIEQLKKEAQERFGEIKEGDRFDRSALGYLDGEIYFLHNAGYKKGFEYEKDDDRLYFDNLVIYKQGKWATRVKERVKVDFDGGNLQSRQFYFIYGKDAESKMQKKGCFKVGEFLATQLEKYLNGEIE